MGFSSWKSGLDQKSRASRGLYARRLGKKWSHMESGAALANLDEVDPDPGPEPGDALGNPGAKFGAPGPTRDFSRNFQRGAPHVFKAHFWYLLGSPSHKTGCKPGVPRGLWGLGRGPPGVHPGKAAASQLQLHCRCSLAKVHVCTDSFSWIGCSHFQKIPEAPVLTPKNGGWWTGSPEVSATVRKSLRSRGSLGNFCQAFEVRATNCKKAIFKNLLHPNAPLENLAIFAADGQEPARKPHEVSLA